MDKSLIYNLDPKPVGGEWVVMMNLTKEEQEKVENGEYNGFSIEAMFQGFDALEQSKELTEDETIKQIIKILENGNN